MEIKIKNYQKPNPEKLDAVGTGISIEKKHKEFIEKNSINLSALVRDVLDKLIQENKVENKNE